MMNPQPGFSSPEINQNGSATNRPPSAMSTINPQQAAMFTNNAQQTAMFMNNVPQGAVSTNNVPQGAMSTNNAQQAAMSTNNAQQAAMSTINAQQAAISTINAQQAAMFTINAQQAAMCANNVPQATVGNAGINNVPQAAMFTNNAPQAAMCTNNVPQAAMCTNNVQRVAIGANNFPQAAMSYPVQLVYDAEIQINAGAGMSNYSLVIVKPQPLIMVPSPQQYPALQGSNSIPPWLQKYATPVSQPQNYQNVINQPNYHIQRPYGNATEASACVTRNAIATAHPGQMANNLNPVFQMQPAQESNQNYQLIPLHQNMRYFNQGNNNGVLANDKGINPENPTLLTNQMNNALFANGQRNTENPSNFIHSAPNSFTPNVQRISTNPSKTQGIVKQTHMRGSPNQAIFKPKPINVVGSNPKGVTFGVRRMSVSSNEMLMTNLANAYTQENATTTTNATQTPTKYDTNKINWNSQSVFLAPTAVQNKASQMTISHKNKILAPPILPKVIVKDKRSDNADKGGISNNPFEAEPQDNAKNILTSTTLLKDKGITLTKENAEISTSNTSEVQPIELQMDTKIYHNRKRERSCQDGEHPKCKIMVTENNERETMTSSDHLSKMAGLKNEEDAGKETRLERKRKVASILEEKGSYQNELSKPFNQSNKNTSKEVESNNVFIQKVMLENEEQMGKKGQDKINCNVVSDNEKKEQGEGKDTLSSRKLKGINDKKIDEKTTTDQNNENGKRFDEQKDLENAKFTNKTSVLKHSVGGVVIRESKCSFEKKFGSQDIANMISNNEDLEKYIPKNEVEISNTSDDEEQVKSTEEVDRTSETDGQNNLQSILSHVINGFVIQESNKPFAIRGRNERLSVMSRPGNTKTLATENKNIQNDNSTEKNTNNKAYKVCLKASITETDAITNENDATSDKLKIIEINHTAEKDNISNDTAKNTKRAKMIRKRKAYQEDITNRDTIIKKKKGSEKNIKYSDGDTTEEDSDDDDQNIVPEMKNPQPVNSVKLKTWSSGKLHSYLRATWCDCLESLKEQDVDGRALLLASRRQLIDIGVHAAHARTLCQFARHSRKLWKG